MNGFKLGLALRLGGTGHAFTCTHGWKITRDFNMFLTIQVELLHTHTLDRLLTYRLSTNAFCGDRNS